MKIRGSFIGINSEAYTEEIDMPSDGHIASILEAADYLIIGLPDGSTVQYSKLPLSH